VVVASRGGLPAGQDCSIVPCLAKGMTFCLNSGLKRPAAADCGEWKIRMYKGDTHKETHKNAERDIIGKEFADEDREEDDQYLKEKIMRAIVDKDLCIACGICEGIAPEVFSLQREPYAEVLLDPIPAELEAAVEEAKEECPEGAITIEA